MNVIQVTHRYPPQTGGVETHVMKLSEQLVDQGHDVTVFTADSGEGGTRKQRRNGVEVRRLRAFAPGKMMYVAPGIVCAIRNHDADVIHAHNYHAIPALFAALGVENRRFVFTTHYHGLSASSFRDRLLSLYEPAGRWAVRRADEVIAVSEWERDRLRADFGVDATMIPNGLDVERFVNAEQEARDRPYLLYVGRLEEYKGVQYAIRALPELSEYDLIVAGSGQYRGELERIAYEVGVTDRTEFLGFVDGDQLPGLYAGAEAFLALSSFEAYGMTIAEALATGTPCVVRECTALSDWIGSEGVVGISDRTVRNPEALAEVIRKAAGQPVSTHVPTGWHEVVEQTIPLYLSD